MHYLLLSKRRTDMKYAHVDGQKTEATKGAKGTCPCCGAELIAKCGEKKIHHWAHKGNRDCDKWWENESEWHRSWKNHFPVDWQEVVQFDHKTNEKHIADVKTSEDWVLEFQHSYIKPEEAYSRNVFYKKLVWVVNGTRRKTDMPQLSKVINDGTRFKYGNINIYKVSFPEESRLLREWKDSGVPVFFDFQKPENPKQSGLWFLIPRVSKNRAYFIVFSRPEFIQLHNNKGFNELIYKLLPKLRNQLVRNG